MFLTKEAAVILLITLSSVSHYAFAAPLAEKNDAYQITARTLSSGSLRIGGHSHSRMLLQISFCGGLSNVQCENDAGCEQAGFVGEKYCTDAPAPPPRDDLIKDGIRSIHIAINGSNSRNCGAEASPCATLEFASRMAASGDALYLHSGRYKQPTQRLTLVGTKSAPIVITAFGTDDVRFEASTRIDNKGANVSLWDSGTAIECSNCHHVIFKKLHLDGRADSLFFEDAIKNHYWSDKRIEFVGYSGIQIIDGGTYVELSEMLIHDMLCTGVYLKGTRYATVKNNILYRIGHHCMVGGGGLMYGGIGQVPGDYGDGDPDDLDVWRMDYYGNLVFDVEQRLYSWVKKDNTLTMHLDEGKTLDTQGAATDNNAKFRIAENLVLFPGVLGMRIKRLPNGLVKNNSIYLESDKYDADGVRVTDNFDNPTLVFSNNAVNAGPGAFALDLRGAQPYEGDTNRFNSNYLSGGGYLYAGDIRPATMKAVVDLGPNGTLFSKPDALDFSIASAVPQGVGVSPSNYERMMAMARAHDIEVVPMCHRTDHEQLVQKIINSAPPTDFFDPTFVQPDNNNPDVAEIQWTAGNDWKNKYGKYKNNPLIMHLHGEYASELFAWNHNPLNGYIDRQTQHANLDCSRINGSKYCKDVRGCTCEGVCEQCLNDAGYVPARDGTTRKLPKSAVPCISESQTRRGIGNATGDQTSSSPGSDVANDDDKKPPSSDDKKVLSAPAPPTPEPPPPTLVLATSGISRPARFVTAAVLVASAVLLA